jgi:hypothetical protein
MLDFIRSHISISDIQVSNVILHGELAALTNGVTAVADDVIQMIIFAKVQLLHQVLYQHLKVVNISLVVDDHGKLIEADLLRKLAIHVFEKLDLTLQDGGQASILFLVGVVLSFTFVDVKLYLLL